MSCLFVDVVGRRLLRVHEEKAAPQEHGDDQVPLVGSVCDGALRTRKPVLVADGAQEQRVLAAVTNRGDSVGVLELYLVHVAQDVLEQVEEAAHALAYIIVTDRRFTDLHHWGSRTATITLAAEIQRQLLPSAPSCEAPEFALAGALVPASDIAGDPYDYSLDEDTLHVSITDAMGHDVDASLMATLLVNASRGVRRAGLAEQARQAHRALLDHGRRTFATGQFLRIALDGTGASSSAPATSGRCGCATARSTKSRCTSIFRSVSPRRAPTRYRTSTCVPATASCSTPTACRNARQKPSTSPASSATPPPSTLARPYTPWSPRSPKRAKAM